MPSFLDSEPIKANEYFGVGRVTEFKYGVYLSDAFHGHNQLKYLKNYGEGWGMMPNGNALVFIDNHDNQRGSGGGGSLLTFREPKPYKVKLPPPPLKSISLVNILIAGFIADGRCFHVGLALRFPACYVQLLLGPALGGRRGTIT